MFRPQRLTGYISLVAAILSLSWENMNGQSITWAKKVDFGDTGGGNIYELSVDANGNSYVSGMSWPTANFGGGFVSTSAGSNAFIAKYDAAGNTVWANRLSNAAVGFFHDIHVAANGDLFFTARWTTSANLYGIALPTLPALDFGGVVGRMSASGQMLGVTTFMGSGNCEMNHLAEASNGDIFASGVFSGTLQVGAQTLTSVGPKDMFVVRMTQGGTVLWVQQIQGDFQSYGQGNHEIVADANDNLILTSFMLGTIQIGGASHTTNGGMDVLLAKFDPNGNLLWSSNYGGSGTDAPAGLVVDGAGNIYWTGQFFSTMAVGGTTLTANGTLEDLMIAKVSPGGTPIWAVSGGGTAQDRPSGLAINANAELFVCGVHGQFANFGGISLNNLNTAANHMVLKYDSTGAIVSAGHWGRPGSFGANNGSPTTIAVDVQGHPRIAGHIVGIYDFDGIQLSQTGQSTDGYIARIVDNANWITGDVYRDFNQNGTLDIGESGFPAAIVELTPGPRYFFSDASGEYRAGTDIGNYSLSIPSPPLYHTVTAPATHNASFATLGNVDSLNHFGLYPTPNINDLRITLTAYTPARPGDTVYFQIHYTNIGTTTLSGTIQFLPDQLLGMLGTSPVADTTINDTLFWSFSGLAPQAHGNIIVSCAVPLLPVISLGDTLDIQAWISPLAGDAAPADNYAQVLPVVVGAYDPNDKTAFPGGDLLLADVGAGMWLDYLIRFQNTGTDTAFQVIVRDSLHPNLDISSFEMLAASHNYHVNLSGPGHLAWYFNQILLPDSGTNEAASHGFIRYRIRPKASLQPFDRIENSASIYFDLNPPIVTNTTLNTVIDPLALYPMADGLPRFSVHPNPSRGAFTLHADVLKPGIAQATVLDLQGRPLKTMQLRMTPDVRQYPMDCAGLAKGMYLLKVEQGPHSQAIKVVIN